LGTDLVVSRPLDSSPVTTADLMALRSLSLITFTQLFFSGPWFIS
jgi:hypothetical protein